MATELRGRAPSSWRDRFDPIPGQARHNRLRLGAIATVATMFFLWVIYTKPTLPGLGKDGDTYVADFGYASNLYPGRTPVRVHGVEVGLVKSVERGPGGRGVRVELQVDDGRGVKLHEDATLAVRWKTLLGRNMYLDLDEGSPSAPLKRDDYFPRSATSNQVELDTALEPLDAKGRGAFKTMISQFDGAFSEPKALSDTVDAVAPAMRQVARGTRGFRGTIPGQDLPRLISSTSRAMAALARDETALAGVIDHGNVALGVTAARRADLAQTLDTAPAALREARTTMQRLIATLDEVDPLATKLMPGARKLSASTARTQRTLALARPLLRDLRPTLSDLRPAVADLSSASSNGAPAFAPLTRVLERTERSFLPFLSSKDPENGRITYQSIGPALASASSALAYGDTHQVTADFEANAGENLVTGFSPCKTQIADPTAALAEKVQCELLARSLVAALTGRKPAQVRLKNSAVPESRLQKFLKGNATLKWGRLGQRPDLKLLGDKP